MASRAVTPPSSPRRWSGSRARTCLRCGSRPAPTRSPLLSRRPTTSWLRPPPTVTCPLHLLLRRRELRRILIPRTTVNKGAARGPRRRGSGKLYLRDQERQQETRSRGEGDPRAAFPVGVGHERVGKRGEHRASSEGEQHRQRPLPRSRECDIAEHYSGG